MSLFARWIRFVLGSLLVALVSYKISVYFYKCGTGSIKKVCSEYRNNKTSGEFCAKLCSNDAIVTRCLSVNQDKSVFEMQLQARKYIVKLLNIDVKEESHQNNELKFFKRFNGSNWVVPFRGSCGRFYAADPVPYLAGEIFGHADDVVDLLNMPDSMDIFLIYGSGDNSSLLSYFVQKTNPLKEMLDKLLYRSFVQAYSPTFVERLQFIKKLLLWLERFTIATEGQFVMCDIHMNNIGLNSNNTIELIDADHILQINTVKEMYSQMSCSSNQECHIGDHRDCFSACDDRVQRCRPLVALTNLKNLCVVITSIVMAPMTEEELSIVRPLYDKIEECPNSFSMSPEDEVRRIRTILNSISWESI